MLVEVLNSKKVFYCTVFKSKEGKLSDFVKRRISWENQTHSVNRESDANMS